MLHSDAQYIQCSQINRINNLILIILYCLSLPPELALVTLINFEEGQIICFLAFDWPFHRPFGVISRWIRNKVDPYVSFLSIYDASSPHPDQDAWRNCYFKFVHRQRQFVMRLPSFKNLAISFSFSKGMVFEPISLKGSFQRLKHDESLDYIA